MLSSIWWGGLSCLGDNFFVSSASCPSVAQVSFMNVYGYVIVLTISYVLIHFYTTSSGIYYVRPIGAVVYMQRRNLKMCLRTTDGATDTSEVAKVGISVGI